jgi:hypothetical protein
VCVCFAEGGGGGSFLVQFILIRAENRENVQAALNRFETNTVIVDLPSSPYVLSPFVV